jgi:hypothetical protein
LAISALFCRTKASMRKLELERQFMIATLHTLLESNAPQQPCGQHRCRVGPCDRRGDSSCARSQRQQKASSFADLQTDEELLLERRRHNG